MNFIYQIRLKSFLRKYLLTMSTLFLLPSCFLLQTDLGKSLQHRMSASCSANPSGCGVSPQVVANIIQTVGAEIDLQENAISYASNGSLDFGGILQGTSTTKTISIRNLGTADLTLTGSPIVTITGTDATMFTVTQPSTTTIAVGANITFTVTFTPSSTGAKTASISIANDDLDENNYVINLLGTSSSTLSPEINLQENNTNYAANSNFDFGTITQGTQSVKTFTIQNLGTANLNLTGAPIVNVTGTDAAMFSVNQPSASTIAAGSSLTFSVTFNPSSTGAKTASLSIANNDSDESSYTINLLGTSSATLVAEINLQENNISYASNSNFDFGTITQGTQSIKTFTIQNLGTASLNLTGSPIVTITGTDAAMFSVVLQPSSTTIGAGANTTFTIIFNPSSTGSKAASLSIANNDSDESSYVINLLGTSNSALTPEINLQQNSINYALNSSFDFGTITQGTSTVRTFTIQNLGTANLNLTGTPIIAVTGTDAAMFTVTQPTITSFVAGANVTFTVTFNPSSTGTKTASISIANNDLDESNYIINLLGTSNAAPVPEINLQVSNLNSASGSSYDFGDLLNSAQTAPKVVTFTIQNLGTANLNLTGSPIVNVTGTDAAQFTVTQPTNSTISAGGNITFDVSFNISSEGSKTATLSISNNDSDESVYTINLVGTITSPPLVAEIDIKENNINYASHEDFNFGSVAQGFTSTKTFTIANVGTATLNLTGIPDVVTITGTNAGLFELTQPEITTLNQGNSITFNITFSPDSLGTKSASISIANNDSDESNYVINLLGEGTSPAPEIDVKDNGTSIASGNTINFGTVNLPGSINKTFSIENLGTAILSLNGEPDKIKVTGMDANLFTITQPEQSVIASSSAVSFSVSFDPQASGIYSATLEISNNDSDEATYIINIQGEAFVILAPEIEIEGPGKTNYISGETTCDFPITSIGTSIPKSFSIKNSGNADLNLNGTPIISISGDPSFTIFSQPAGTVILPQQFTEFTIEFTPDSTGEKTATISITNNDSDESTFIINLKGNGFAP